jgi:hypothetical protein
VKHILIGQRERRINWSTERGDWVMASGNTKRTLAKKRIGKGLEWFVYQLQRPVKK